MTLKQQQQTGQQQAAFSDLLIRGREALLDRLAGAGPDLVLNPGSSGETMPPPADLAARLKHALDNLKAAAVSEDGVRVDYGALRSDPAYGSYHAEYAGQLRSFRPQDLPSPAAQRAFWINLYNVLVLDAVIAFEVQESVAEGPLGIFSFFRRAAYIVDGCRLSLEDIEHGILRANKGNPYVPGPHFAAADPRRAWSLPLDPRIHFALNCGGASCPPIRSYTAEGLHAQLELAARSFVNSTVQIYPQRRELHLSQLMKWYEKDFGSRAQMLDFLEGHLPDDPRRSRLAASRGNYKLVYTPYDWRLNTP